MFKKLSALLLSLILILSLAACGEKGKEKKPSEKIVLPEQRIALITAPRAQYPEEYSTAHKLAEQYPDKIVVKEYFDSRFPVKGAPDISDISKELAADTSIGAFIYPRATHFTIDAINAAKEINPNLRFICTEPECPIDELSAVSDVILCVDWKQAANDIVSAAKEQGATHFLMFSMNRHISQNPLHAAEREFIEQACAAQGITFVYDNALDPFSVGGVESASKYIGESVARQILNERVPESGFAVYSTDVSVQKTLVNIADARGLIYVSPSFPTAYNGVCEAYPQEYADSISVFTQNLKNAVNANTDGKAGLSVYSYPLAEKMLKASLNITFDILGGKTTSENLAERVMMRAADISADKEFTVGAYHDKDLTNVFTMYYPGYEIIKAVTQE